MGPALELWGVSKSYGLFRPRPALRDVWLRVEVGECFGLALPDRGEVRLLGGDPEDPELRRRVGFVPEASELPPSATPRGLVRRWLRLRRLPAHRYENGVAGLERLGLGRLLDRPVGRLSKGERQRTLMALALLGEPELLILDEPTDGLDPAGRALVRQIISEERRRGRTVFLNSHLLGETERVCSRVAILHRGRLVREADLGARGPATALSTSEITLAGHPSPDALAAAGARLPDAPSAPSPPTSEGAEPRAVVWVDHRDAHGLNHAIDRLRERGLLIVGLEPRRADLEQTYLEVAGGEPGGPGEAGGPGSAGPPLWAAVPLPPLPSPRLRPGRALDAVRRVIGEVLADLAAQKLGWAAAVMAVLGAALFSRLVQADAVAHGAALGRQMVSAMAEPQRQLLGQTLARSAATSVCWLLLVVGTLGSALVAVPYLDPRRTVLLYAQPITRADHVLGLFVGVVGLASGAALLYGAALWATMRWIGLPSGIGLLWLPLPFAAGFSALYGVVLLVTLAFRNGYFAALGGLTALGASVILAQLSREELRLGQHGWTGAAYGLFPKLVELGELAGTLAQSAPPDWWPLASTGLFDLALVVVLRVAASRRET